MTEKNKLEYAINGVRHAIRRVGEQLRGADHGMTRKEMGACVNNQLRLMSDLDELIEERSALNLKEAI